MIGYSYKRFSSKQQAHGTSIARQTSKVEKYCKEHQIELSNISFEDLGLSAYHQRNTDEDAGLGQFIKALESGSVQTPCYLLVESLDRLSRANIKTAMRQLWNITDYNVTVVTLIDQKSYTKDMDFTDFLMAGLIMERANEESRTKAARSAGFWEHKRKQLAQGKAQKGRSPYWLQRNGDKYEVIEEKADVVREVFRLRIAGIGTTGITRELNNTNRVGASSKWSITTVNKLLRNITVMGLYQPHIMEGKEKKPIGEPMDIYPEIVSKADFYKVQSLFKKVKKGSTKSYRNVFYDVIKCRCGGSMVLSQRNVYYLMCTNARDGLCDNRLVPLSLLEKWLRQYLLSPQYFNIWVSSSEKVREHEKKLESLVIQRDTQQEALQALLSNTAVLASPIVMKKVSELSEDIAGLSDQITAYEVPKDNRRLRLDETKKIIDLAFDKEDNPVTIEARTKLKALLQPEWFGKMTVFRNNTNSLYDNLELYVEKPIGLTYKSIGIRDARYKKEVWSGRNADKKPEGLTEAEKQDIIEQFRYKPDA
ncbi:recombinase family protein [Vibrio breoganii]